MWFDEALKPLRKEAQRLVELLEQEGLSLEAVTPDLTTEEIRRTKKFSLVKADEILAYLEEQKEVMNWVEFQSNRFRRKIIDYMFKISLEKCV